MSNLFHSFRRKTDVVERRERWLHVEKGWLLAEAAKNAKWQPKSWHPIWPKKEAIVALFELYAYKPAQQPCPMCDSHTTMNILVYVCIHRL